MCAHVISICDTPNIFVHFYIGFYVKTAIILYVYDIFELYLVTDKN